MKSFKFLSTKPTVWKSADGNETPINELSTSHIENIIACLTGKGRKSIPEIYMGKNKKYWKVVFSEEYARRCKEELHEHQRRVVTT